MFFKHIFFYLVSFIIFDKLTFLCKGEKRPDVIMIMVGEEIQQLKLPTKSPQRAQSELMLQIFKKNTQPRRDEDGVCSLVV